MAKPDEGRLTNRHYTKLADAISGPNMMTIAQGYLDINPDNLESIRVQNLNNVQQTNTEILRRWANKTDNSGPDQRKVSAHRHARTHAHNHRYVHMHTHKHTDTHTDT